MVKAWKEKVVIPTYEVGKPEKILSSLKNVYIREVAEWYILIRLSNQLPMKK